jgi:hypothetical protein
MAATPTLAGEAAVVDAAEGDNPCCRELPLRRVSAAGVPVVGPSGGRRAVCPPTRPGVRATPGRLDMATGVPVRAPRGSIAADRGVAGNMIVACRRWLVNSAGWQALPHELSACSAAFHVLWSVRVWAAFVWRWWREGVS